jgi:hypothetical protein
VSAAFVNIFLEKEIQVVIPQKESFLFCKELMQKIKTKN